MISLRNWVWTWTNKLDPEPIPKNGLSSIKQTTWELNPGWTKLSISIYREERARELINNFLLFMLGEKGSVKYLINIAKAEIASVFIFIVDVLYHSVKSLLSQLWGRPPHKERFHHLLKTIPQHLLYLMWAIQVLLPKRTVFPSFTFLFWCNMKTIFKNNFCIF